MANIKSVDSGGVQQERRAGWRVRCEYQGWPEDVLLLEEGLEDNECNKGQYNNLFVAIIGQLLASLSNEPTFAPGDQKHSQDTDESSLFTRSTHLA